MAGGFKELLDIDGPFVFGTYVNRQIDRFIANRKLGRL